MWQFLTFLYEGFNSKGPRLNKCLTTGAIWSCQNGETGQQNDASCQQKARTFVRAFYTIHLLGRILSFAEFGQETEYFQVQPYQGNQQAEGSIPFEIFRSALSSTSLDQIEV